MTEELPVTEELQAGGTDQLPAASQAAAASDSAQMELGDTAASRPEDTAPVEAVSGASQQQASADENPASDNKPEAAAEAGDGSDQVEDDTTEDDSTAGDNAPQGAPEHYAFKPVEGVQFSDEVLGSFSEVAKELDLSQDAAQQMLDRVAPAIARQQQAALQAVNAEWVSQVKADHEIGGDRLQQNLAIAKKVRDAFGTDGLRALLNESRIGNHPEMIRFFVRAGQAISEDSFVTGGTRPPSAGRDAAAVLYGKQS